MLIKHKRGWEIPEAQATPESVYINRRRFIAGLGGAGAIAAASPARAGIADWLSGDPPAPAEDDPSAGLYPFPRNPAFADAGRPITEESANATYNNFYEFGSHKQISKAAQALRIRPWEIAIDGLVETPFTIGFDDLLAKMPKEERVYRHRCVEAWSMVIPWGGFPMRSLVELCKPLSSAKYVRLETFMNPDVAPGQKQSWYPWPYVEGVTMAEAMNDLAFIATGAYGKPAAKQFGAPLRLHLPWKYGFKSIKSIARISFTDQRPKSFWEAIQGTEYGFWANVNPEVPHPRWSQATERVLGTEERVPTLLYNGYGPQVADLYAGMEGERLFM